MIGDEVIGALRRKAAIRTRARALGEEILAGRYAGWRHDPLQERTVLYESFFGNGMLDNPEAIFRYLLDQPDMADLTHIWALDDLEGHPSVVAEFADDPRVRFVDIELAGLLRGAGHREVPGQQRHLAAALRQARRAGLRQHVARRPAQAHGLRHARRWHRVAQHPRNFLSADYLRLRQRDDDRGHVPLGLPAAGHLPRRGDRGGPTPDRPAGAGAEGPGRGGRAARGARSRPRRPQGGAVRPDLARQHVRGPAGQRRRAGAHRAAAPEAAR